jgi:hypothetical protein
MENATPYDTVAEKRLWPCVVVVVHVAVANEDYAGHDHDHDLRRLSRD